MPNTTLQPGRRSMLENISWKRNGEIWMIKLISSKTRLELFITDIMTGITFNRKDMFLDLTWTLTTRKFMSWDNKKKTSKRNGLGFSMRLQEVLKRKMSNSQMRLSLLLELLLLPSPVLSLEPPASLCTKRDPLVKLTTNFHLSKNEPRNWSNEIEKFELIYNQKSRTKAKKQNYSVIIYIYLYSLLYLLLYYN